MNLIETALYPYRVHLKGSHLHRIWLPEVDFEQATNLIFKMREKKELLVTVDFSQAMQIVDIAMPAEDIQTLSNAYGKEPMIIKDLKGKLEVIAYDQKKEKAVKVIANPSVAQTVKKRTT